EATGNPAHEVVATVGTKHAEPCVPWRRILLIEVALRQCFRRTVGYNLVREEGEESTAGKLGSRFDGNTLLDARSHSPNQRNGSDGSRTVRILKNARAQFLRPQGASGVSEVSPGLTPGDCLGQPFVDGDVVPRADQLAAALGGSRSTNSTHTSILTIATR